jgi:hypothetical protein
MEDRQKLQQALDTARAIEEDDGLATIGKTDYRFTKMKHRERRAVFGFYTKVGQQLQRGDFSFLDTPEWDRIEKLITKTVLVTEAEITISAYDAAAIKDNEPEWWESHADEYLKFVSTALLYCSYPFLKGGLTG